MHKLGSDVYRYLLLDGMHLEEGWRHLRLQWLWALFGNRTWRKRKGECKSKRLLEQFGKALTKSCCEKFTDKWEKCRSTLDHRDTIGWYCKYDRVRISFILIIAACAAFVRCAIV
jgi:hypothetical protein